MSRKPLKQKEEYGFVWTLNGKKNFATFASGESKKEKEARERQERANIAEIEEQKQVMNELRNLLEMQKNEQTGFNDFDRMAMK